MAVTALPSQARDEGHMNIPPNYSLNRVSVGLQSFTFMTATKQGVCVESMVPPDASKHNPHEEPHLTMGFVG